MGINISIGKLGKETKFYPEYKQPYKMIQWSEDEYDIILKDDELNISTSRYLSYYILDELVGDYSYASNDSWYIPLDFELKDKWKRMDILEGSVWVHSEHSEEMKKIVDKLSDARNFYDFAKVIKENNLAITGF